ncbi:MAG: ribonuclease III [bacterium]
MSVGFFSKLRWKFFRKENKSEFQIGGKIKSLEKLIGFSVGDTVPYLNALTHRSAPEGQYDYFQSNERLEFLGDAVLNLVIADKLFVKFPKEGEGYLTKIRSHLVNKDILAECGEKMELQNLIFYNEKFLNGSHYGMKTILADAVEALIGAIYIEGGFEKAREFIFRWILFPNLKTGKYEIDLNFKGQLLEYSHSTRMAQPSYRVVKEEGPEHSKNFTIEVWIDGESYGVGTGKNKKSAEQLAALEALKKLKLVE